MGLCTQQLRRELHHELLHLSFPAFLQTMRELLTAMGYEDVTLTSRKGFVGKHGDGGVDLRAYKWVPGGRRLVVIRVKQFAPGKLIYRHLIDSLRGVVLRENAAEGMLITTTGFPESVNQAEFASAPVAPLRLIDGIELAELMALYKVGVIKEPKHAIASESWYFCDKEYFKMKNAYARGAHLTLFPDRPIPRSARLKSVRRRTA